MEDDGVEDEVETEHLIEVIIFIKLYIEILHFSKVGRIKKSITNGV